MKKILLGTTAIIALATMSTEAFAAEKIKLGLGGFMRQYVGITNSDEVSNIGSNNSTRAMSLSQFSNTEVYFTGSTSLDNGLKVSAKIQLEADKDSSGSIDATELTVSSDAMGALTMGGTPHAGDDFRVGAPNAGNFDHGDFWDWASSAPTAADTATSSNVAGDITGMGGKGIKLKYVSPTFADMVTVFASYGAGEGLGAHNARNLTRNAANDGSTLGAAVSGEVGGASVEVAAIHFRNNGTANVNNFGVNVGTAGFTVGGAYSDFSDDTAANTAADGSAWEMGVGYETGPYSLSARYMNSDNKGTATAGSNEDTVWSVAATYDLGAGVALSATYFDASADAEGTTASVDTSGIIAGIEVGF